MVLNDTPRLDKSAFLMLPVLALAFYVAFIPHQGYPFPVHIDDWIHLAHSEAILKAGSTTYIEPFLGETTMGLSSNLELGFQLFFGVFQRISGISWFTIFRYFPSLILMLTVLSVYVMGQRHGFGWQAAFFTCLIPTTVGILGPAFLVPVAMGLFFIPLSLFIAFNFRGIWACVVLFIFTCFLVAIHAPSAICLVIILFPYILLNLKGNFRHSLCLLLAVGIPFLAPFPWIFGMLGSTAKQLLTPQVLPDYVDFPFIIKTYGYIPVGLCILGALVLALRGGKKNYGLVIGLLALLAMLVTFFTFHYGVSIMYERGLMFMMLMMGILAGAGLMAVNNLRLPEWLTAKTGGSHFKHYLGWFCCLALIVITLYIGIPQRQGIDYYHMIDEEDYQAFVWIKENVGEEYDRAILDPWKGIPFTAITGKYVYTRIHAFPTETDVEAKMYLDGGCTDTTLLRENGISVVYSENECLNPDLVEVNERVYLLPE